VCVCVCVRACVRACCVCWYSCNIMFNLCNVCNFV